MKLIIFGTSDIARCAYEYFTHDSDYEVMAFCVDAAYLDGEDSFMDLPLVAFEEITKQFPPSDYHAFIAVGSGRLNRNRIEKYEAFKSMGYSLASYISSKAFVWPNVKLGEHVFIQENNTLQPFVEIGDNVTLWAGNHIGHSSVIEDHCFLASQIVVSGLCHIGTRSFIGVNATISDTVKIGADNFITLGAIVTKDTQEDIVTSSPKSAPHKVSATRYCKVQER